MRTPSRRRRVRRTRRNANRSPTKVPTTPPGTSFHVVAEGEQLTAQMMSTNAGLHDDLARPHVSEKNHDLTAGQLLTQHNHAAWRPTKWNEFLPMSMPIVVAVLSLALLSMARAPRAWLRPQSAGTSTAGPSHQRTCRSSTMWSRRQRH